MAAPNGLIVAWPSTVASIPSGWTRVTGLDGKHPKASTSYNSTGGSVNHSHSGASHSHADTHTHANSTGSNNSSAAIVIASPGALTIAADPHTHPHSFGATTTTATANTATSTSVDSVLSTYTVIFIISDGTTDIPVNAVMWWSTASPPTNWAYADGGGGRPDLRNKFLLGAATGADGGTAVAASSHTHTASHQHSGVSHSDHAVTVGNDSGGTGNRASIGTPTVALTPHGHSVGSLATSSATPGSYAADATASDGQTPEPPWYKLLPIVKTGASSVLPVGIIGMFNSGTAPGSWTVADGTNSSPNLNGNAYFLKGAATTGEIGNTGGASSHTHTVTHGSGHTIAAHTHTSTGTSGTASSTSNYNSGGANNAVDGSHTHTGSTSGAASSNTGSAGMTLSANSSNDPAYVTVVFIQKLIDPVTADVTTSAVVTATVVSNLTTSAVVTTTPSSDVSSSAVITATVTSDVTSSAVVTATVVANVTTSAAIVTTNTSDLSTTAAITATVVSDVSSSAVVTATVTSDVTTSLVIGNPVSADVSSSAVVTTTVNSDLTSAAVITATVVADVTTSAVITRTRITKPANFVVRSSFDGTARSQALGWGVGTGGGHGSSAVLTQVSDSAFPVAPNEVGEFASVLNTGDWSYLAIAAPGPYVVGRKYTLQFWAKLVSGQANWLAAIQDGTSTNIVIGYQNWTALSGVTLFEFSYTALVAGNVPVVFISQSGSNVTSTIRVTGVSVNETGSIGYTNAEPSVYDYKATVLADTPTAYWRLGESSGTTAADASGNGKTGTYTSGGNAVTYSRPGALVGNADTGIGFGAGGNTSIQMASSGFSGLLGGTFSVEAWFNKPVIQGSNFERLVARQWVTNGWLLGYYDQNIQFGLGDSGGSQHNAATSKPVWDTFLPGWHHAVGTYDGSNVRLYVDGQLLVTSAYSGWTPGTASSVVVGSGSQAYDIDEVAIYDGVALTLAQIQKHYYVGSYYHTDGEPWDVATTAVITTTNTSDLSTTAAITATVVSNVTTSAVITATVTADVTTSAYVGFEVITSLTTSAVVTVTRSTSGGFLYDFEAGAAPFAAHGTGVTATQSTDVAHSGTKSLKVVTSSGTFAGGKGTSTGVTAFRVSTGQWIGAMHWIYSAVPISNIELGLEYGDSAGGYAGGYYPLVNHTGSGWESFFINTTVPAGKTTVGVMGARVTDGLVYTFYLDDIVYYDNILDIATSAAITTTNTADVTTSAVIAATVTSDVASSAVITATVTSDVSSAAVVTTTVTSDVSTSSVITTTGTRDVTTSAYLGTEVIASLTTSATIALVVTSDVTTSAVITVILRPPGVRIDVCDTNGNRVGFGPLRPITTEYDGELDKLGSFAIEVPGDELRAFFITDGSQINIHVGNEGLVFRGIAKVIEDGVDLQGRAVRKVSGPSLGQQLVFRNTLLGLGFAGSTLAATMGSDATAGSLLYQTGWATGTLGVPSYTLSARFDGVTRFEAMQKVAKTFGYHVREDSISYSGGSPVKKIDLAPLGESSGLTFRNLEGGITPYTQENRGLVPIGKPKRVSDSDDLWNRIILLGAGEGLNLLTLAECTRSVAGGFRYDVVHTTGADGLPLHYIEDTASQALYGIRERVVKVTQAAPLAESTASRIAASNALYDVGAEYLRTHANPLVTWTFEPAYMKHVANNVALFKVGQTARLVYRGIAHNRSDARDRGFLATDQTVWIMGFKRKITADISDTWSLKVSNIDRVATDAGAQLYSDFYTLNVAMRPYTYTESWTLSPQPLNASTTAQMRIKLRNVALVHQAILSWQYRALRSNVTTTATDSGSAPSTSSGGSSTPTSSSGASHSHTVTITSHTHGLTTGTVDGQGSHRHTVALYVGSATDFIDNISLTASTASTDPQGGHNHVSASTDAASGPGSHAHTVSGGSGTTHIDHVHGLNNHRHTINGSQFQFSNSGGSPINGVFPSTASIPMTQSVYTYTADGTHTHTINALTLASGGSSTPTSSAESSHTHTVTISAHTHSVTIPSHSHALTYGIFNDSTPTAIAGTLTVNGTDRTSALQTALNPAGPWGTAGTLYESDLTAYLQDGATPTVAQLDNTFVFGAAKLCDVEATLKGVFTRYSLVPV